uniref:Plant defensin 1.2-like protein PDF1.2-2 n=1 Tax=Dimocarpus longan TaxID=128017 RepID=A0A0F6TMG2_9ROSI|nr:plant defensin 1.2-like protein PDF1.2-2 [Dimocarpus longan]
MKMERSVHLFSTVVVFVLVLLAPEMGVQTQMVAHARICESPSAKFKGICFSKSNCANICQTEGFVSGNCRVFKCICSKDC